VAEKKRRGRTKKTITREVQVARRVRVEAAKNDTSMARFLGELLKKKKEEADANEAAMREHLAMVKPRVRRKPGERFPTRDELHDRPKRRT
jgi:hypothetical protein